jgi:ankyrin repeat protein
MDNITPYSQVRAAIDNRDLGLARDLLRRHVEWIKEQGWLNDLLRHAAQNDNVEMVALLVEEFDADIHSKTSLVKDPSPEGVIYDAARDGAVNVVRWLLEHGARVNYQVEGVTRCVALTSAACGGHLDVVKLLVEQGGADINATWAGQNALSFAMVYGQKEVEDYLRSRGAREPGQLAPPPAATTDPILAHVEKHSASRSRWPCARSSPATRRSPSTPCR